MGVDATRRLGVDAPTAALFTLGGAVAFAVLLTLTAGFTFHADEWDVILRPDWSPRSLFAPLNEHIVVGQVIVFKLLLAIFGLGSTVPFRVANIAFLLGIAGLMYALVERRLGAFMAAVLAGGLLLFGPAWEDLLWPAGISFMGAILGGLAAFAALESEARRADLVCCALLVASVSFSTLGLAFVVGVAVDVLLRPGERLVRTFIPAVPIVLYLVWYARYGHLADGHASLENAEAIPAYVWHAASAAVASLAGLSGIGAQSLGTNPGNGELLLAIMAACAVWAVWRNPTLLSRSLARLLATALFFWIAATINQIPGREPGASRYQLASGVLVILIASEALRNWRPQRGARVLIAAIAVAVIFSNLGALRQGADFLRVQSEDDSAALAALDGARDQVPDDRVLTGLPGSPFTAPMHAGDYFAAVDRWGSPVPDPSHALGSTEAARETADSFLAAAYDLRLTPTVAVPRVGNESCSRLPRNPSSAATDIEIPPGGVILRSDAGLKSVRLVRWSQAPAFGVDLGAAPRGAVRLAVPADAFDQPWQAEVVSPGSIERCLIS